MPQNRLDGQLAIVTGASRGIGRAIADRFLQEGARVILVSRRQESLDVVAEALNAEHEGRAIPLALHVGHISDISPWFDAVVEQYGVPQILVNNAGTNPHFGPFIDVEWPAWEKTFEVNLKGPFELARQLSRRLIRDNLSGSIINISSIYGLTAAPAHGVYSLTKAALIAMTKSLALELGSKGIRVNAIAPGLIETRLSQALIGNEAIMDSFYQRTSIQRPGKPSEIAGLAAYLASDDASYTTGQVMAVDGGFTSR
jgi:NAD(P)-dependent dehydrogenase (short-subunit alcohol dehydrogenase family)